MVSRAKRDNVALSAYRLGPNLVAASLLVFSSDALSHASEQAFVLLLPTDFYIGTGVLAVVLTILLLVFMPDRLIHRLFSARPISLKSTYSNKIETVCSTLSALLLMGLLWLGIAGPHDPLKNLLPLVIWTVWWIGLVILQGVIGDIWRFVNPWTGPYRLLSRFVSASPPARVSSHAGTWVASITLLVFIAFSLADIAPDDPDRLSMVVALYWVVTLILLFVFGENWLPRAECFTVLMNFYGQLAPVRRDSNAQWFFGMPGWHAVAVPTVGVGAAVFVLFMLGSGSFDGLNETFKWLAFIGVNPLEFPGRSAVVGKTVTGLIVANILLIVVFGLCTMLGVSLANRRHGEQPGGEQTVGFKVAFSALAISMLPIAFAYHFAHFLTAFMVNIQYTVAALSDPMNSGSDWLGLGQFYVTTGFMNSHHTVQAIWLTQAAVVVIGHVISVIIAHAIAVNLFGNARQAIISQAPLAAFMVLYTFIGLWLLAAPRGA